MRRSGGTWCRPGRWPGCTPPGRPLVDVRRVGAWLRSEVNATGDVDPVADDLDVPDLTVADQRHGWCAGCRARAGCVRGRARARRGRGGRPSVVGVALPSLTVRVTVRVPAAGVGVRRGDAGAGAARRRSSSCRSAGPRRGRRARLASNPHVRPAQPEVKSAVGASFGPVSRRPGRRRRRTSPSAWRTHWWWRFGPRRSRAGTVAVGVAEDRADLAGAGAGAGGARGGVVGQGPGLVGRGLLAPVVHQPGVRLGRPATVGVVWLVAGASTRAPPRPRPSARRCCGRPRR